MKMRKSTFVSIVAGILVGILLGTILNIILPYQEADAASTMGFEVIDKSFGFTWIVYDVETGVMYALSYGSYNAGTMTLMVNPDGTPRVYEGFSRP